MRPHLPVSLISLLGATASAQTAISRAETALDTLNGWYNQKSGIWDTCGWWNGANCMTVLADLARFDKSEFVQSTALEVFNNTFHVAPSASNPHPYKPPQASQLSSSSSSSAASSTSPTPSPSATDTSNGDVWVNGSYDDDSWWALAWIAAYDLTKKEEYLKIAIGIWEIHAATKQSPCGNGGIYSDHNNGYVNAITNELFLSVGAHLANRAPNGKKYLDRAQREWEWFRDSNMFNENGTINDGLTEDCKNNGQTEWSYNQGVVLGALVELARASPEKSDEYLKSASDIAKAAINVLADKNHVIRESCDPDSCDANSTQFKGIFIRNLRFLHSVAPDEKFAQVIRASAESIWNNDRDAQNNKLGEVWAGPLGDQVDASTHSSAMDALVADIGL